jgi:uncharacterized protein YjbI with pentapeptide repeats
MLRGAIAIGMILVASLTGASAQAPVSAPAPPECVSDDIRQWTKQEYFLWRRVLQGEPVNFEKEQEYGDAMSPCRILRPKFLESILLIDIYRNRITRHGVLITGARFTDRLDLVNAELQYEFWLTNSILDKGANLSGLRTSQLISFYGTKTKGLFNLSGLRAGSDLLITGKADLGYVDLGGAIIDGQLDLRESIMQRGLYMAGIRVNGNLEMNKGDFAFVNLKNAQIKGNLDLSSGVFRTGLDMSGARIDGALLVGELRTLLNATMSDLVFSRANLGKDPIASLKNLMTQAHDAGLSSQNYSRLAKSYSDAGQPGIARSILIEGQNAEYKHAPCLTKWYLYGYWLIAGYGYRPELGFVWIFIFVVIGWAIFRTAKGGVVSPGPPDSWFVFALDSVIPGIHLKKSHEEIAFSDWRKYILYFLRFLGAIAVFIVLELLKRIVVETN